MKPRQGKLLTGGLGKGFELRLVARLAQKSFDAKSYTFFQAMWHHCAAISVGADGIGPLSGHQMPLPVSPGVGASRNEERWL